MTARITTGRDSVKKYRLSTTISTKHWSLLNKYSEKYETQQKALERALECLDSSTLMSSLLSEEDKAWLLVGRDLRPQMVLVPKEMCKTWLETVDMDQFPDYVDKFRPMEFVIEYYYQKPLKACTLQEVLDCIILSCKISNNVDIISNADAGDYYELNITHTLGINLSKCHVMVIGSALRSYGVRFEYTLSERTVFFKIYKNDETGGIPGKSKEGQSAKPV
jgi:hypothetical protein